jgi:hypothetical protein
MALMGAVDGTTIGYCCNSFVADQRSIARCLHFFRVFTLLFNCLMRFDLFGAGLFVRLQTWGNRYCLCTCVFYQCNCKGILSIFYGFVPEER